MKGYIVLIAASVFVLVLGILLTIERKNAQKDFDKYIDKSRTFLANKGFVLQKEITLDKYTTFYKYSPYVIAFDNKNKQIGFIDAQSKSVNKFPYSALMSYEVYENSNMVISGTIGTALAGGLMGGVTGAVIGSSASKKQNKEISSLKLLIRVEDFEKPLIQFELINYEIDSHSEEYISSINKLKEVFAYFEYIKNNQENKGNQV